jgi:hypothetical protein
VRARVARHNGRFHAPVRQRDYDGGHLDLGYPLVFRYADLLRRRGREVHDPIVRIRPAVLDGDDRALPGLEIGYFCGRTERKRLARSIGAIWVHSGAVRHYFAGKPFRVKRSLADAFATGSVQMPFACWRDLSQWLRARRRGASLTGETDGTGRDGTGDKQTRNAGHTLLPRQTIHTVFMSAPPLLVPALPGRHHRLPRAARQKERGNAPRLGAVPQCRLDRARHAPR